MSRVKIALVGIGKIARDQHVPVIAASPAFELVAAASPHQHLAGVPNFQSLEALLEGVPEVEAISICTTPQARYPIARLALKRDRHVMLEKPPGVTLNEVHALTELAARRGRSLFATWHSREASGVEPARRWLGQRRVLQVKVQWKEDVRVWHPGQTWIWQAGGLGVFDPGINALSILTRILPGTLVMQDAELDFPSNCQTPIASRLQLSNEHGTAVSVELDFLHAGEALWNIDVETDGGRLHLSRGGAVLHIDGAITSSTGDVEYRNLYAHFAHLIAERHSDVDLAPFTLVADAFLRGRRVEVAPFSA
jgi:D-galactose 1-dehydrogenase